MAFLTEEEYKALSPKERRVYLNGRDQAVSEGRAKADVFAGEEPYSVFRVQNPEAEFKPVQIAPDANVDLLAAARAQEPSRIGRILAGPFAQEGHRKELQEMLDRGETDTVTPSGPFGQAIVEGVVPYGGGRLNVKTTADMLQAAQPTMSREEAIERAEALNAKMRAENPLQTIGGNIMGGAVTGTAGAGGVAAASPRLMGMTAPRYAVGAGLGAGENIGLELGRDNEADWDKAGQEGAIGGAIGTGVGDLLGLGGTALKRTIMNRASPATAVSNVHRRAGKDIFHEGGTVSKAMGGRKPPTSDEIADMAAREGGPNTLMADLDSAYESVAKRNLKSGDVDADEAMAVASREATIRQEQLLPDLQGATRKTTQAAEAPGDHANRLDTELTARRTEFTQALNNNINKHTGQPFELSAERMERMVAKTFEGPQSAPSAATEEILQRHLRSGKGATASGTYDANSVKIFHKDVSDRINALKKEGILPGSNEVDNLLTLQGKLSNALNIVEGFAAPNAAYREAYTQAGWMDEGRDFLRVKSGKNLEHVEILEKNIARATPDQLEGMKLGFAHELENSLLETDPAKLKNWLGKNIMSGNGRVFKLMSALYSPRQAMQMRKDAGRIIKEHLSAQRLARAGESRSPESNRGWFRDAVDAIIGVRGALPGSSGRTAALRTASYRAGTGRNPADRHVTETLMTKPTDPGVMEHLQRLERAAAEPLRMGGQAERMGTGVATTNIMLQGAPQDPETDVTNDRFLDTLMGGPR